MQADKPSLRPVCPLPQECHTLTPDDAPAWSNALAAIDGQTRFLCEKWLPLLASSYGFAPRLLTLFEGGAITAALPYVIVASPLTGKRAVSLPFFDICRPYAPGPTAAQALYARFKQQGKESGWDYIELRGDVEKLHVAEPSLTFYNHVVDLDGGPEQVFARMFSSTRRAIRKAQKSGVTVERSQELAAMQQFYRLQCLTRKRHGLPPQPFAFFRNLFEQIIAPGGGQLFSAYFEGEIVASSIYLVQDNTVHYKYGASDSRFQSARSNNLVMWEAAAHYASLGYRRLDLGRNSLSNEGLRKYKQSWGSEERITYYHRYDLKKERIMKMTDDAYGWHNHIFARLPRPLAQLAGSLLYRHIA